MPEQLKVKKIGNYGVNTDLALMELSPEILHIRG